MNTRKLFVRTCDFKKGGPLFPVVQSRNSAVALLEAVSRKTSISFILFCGGAGRACESSHDFYAELVLGQHQEAGSS